MANKVWDTIKLKTFLSWDLSWAFCSLFVWSKKSFCLMIIPPPRCPERLTPNWAGSSLLWARVSRGSGEPQLDEVCLPLNEKFNGLHVIPKPKESNCWNHSILELRPGLQKTLSALVGLYHILWMSALSLNSFIVWDGKLCFPIHVHLKL